MQERVKGHVEFHKENLKDLGDKVNELSDRLKQTHGKLGKHVEELKSSFNGKLKEFVDKLFRPFQQGGREKRDAEEEAVEEEANTPKGLLDTFKDLHIENQARFRELRDTSVATGTTSSPRSRTDTPESRPWPPRSVTTPRS
ncbi:hypothetical protein HDE_13978 [Halotydeus destructor]|nr:hypothetical protein HDE_13978 [Halotydeus destructor]